MPRKDLPHEATIHLATAIGCQPEVIPDYPREIRAICPFEPVTMQAQNPAKVAKNLHIKLDSGRFVCESCKISGTSAEFLGAVWRCSASDAARIAPSNLAEITLQRPDDPDPTGLLSPEQPTRRQDTALLTDATDFHRKCIGRSIKARKYLAPLGIPSIYVAAANNFGYGGEPPDTPQLHNLASYLRASGYDKRRIRKSGINNPNNSENGENRELLAGMLTYAETDRMGNTLWICGTPATPDEPLSKEPPPVTGMPGIRPPLAGITSLRQRTEVVIVTDDFRLFCIARCYGAPSLYLIRLNPKDIPRTGKLLNETDAGKIILACHNSRFSASLKELLGQVPAWDSQSIIDFIGKPYSRDWAGISAKQARKVRDIEATEWKRRRRKTPGTAVSKNQPTRVQPLPLQASKGFRRRHPDTGTRLSVRTLAG